MKISCQSCEAKYTIADEKVRGKVVKIRCKKCNATIVVKGTELTPPVNADYDDAPTRVLDREELPLPSGGTEWTINVSEDEQRTVSTEELVELFRGGIIDDDTFGWRDGMDDWLALGEIQELRGILPRKSALAPPPPSLPASSPAPSSGRAAVRQPEARASSTDLFGAAAFAGSESDVMTSASANPTMSDSSQQLTGARNESSVLFSLSALTGSGSQPKLAAAADESSSIVDIKNLMGPQAGPKKPAPASKVEDIMNLGGGGIFSPSLAAPMLTGDSVAPEASSNSANAGEAASSKGKGILFGAIGLGAVALVAVGAVLFVGKGSEEPQPLTAAATSTASAQPAEGDPAKADEAADSQSETAAPAQSAEAPAPVAAEKDEAPVEPAVAREREKAPATTPAKAPEKQPAKTVAAATKPAPAPKPAAPAPAPAPKDAPAFDRAAALSSLNAASDAAASACKKAGGPTGSGRIAVTFAPSGVVTTAMVEGPPFAGTAVGGCVAARFRNARVPAFSGGMVTVRKSFTIN